MPLSGLCTAKWTNRLTLNGHMILEQATPQNVARGIYLMTIKLSKLGFVLIFELAELPATSSTCLSMFLPNYTYYQHPYQLRYIGYLALYILG